MFLREDGCNCPDLVEVCRAELEGVAMPAPSCPIHDPAAAVAAAAAEADRARAEMYRTATAAEVARIRAEMADQDQPVGAAEPDDLRALVLHHLDALAGPPSTAPDRPSGGAVGIGSSTIDAMACAHVGVTAPTPPREDPFNEWPPQVA